MLNMIKLDWLGMKYYWARIIIVPLLIGFIGLFNEALIIPVLAYAMLSFSVNPFAVEEKGKLDNLYLTLPVSRKTIVNARLGLSLVMQLVGIALGIVLTIILSSFLYGKTILDSTHNFRPDFASMLLIICGGLFFYAIMNLSMFPVLFKIGYAKGKAIGFYIPIGVSFALFFGGNLLREYNSAVREKLTSTVEWALANPYPISAILFAAAATILAISFTLSHKLYAKREF